MSIEERVNVPESTVRVDTERGRTFWRRAELYNPGAVESGHILPNPGDIIDEHQVVTGVNYQELRYTARAMSCLLYTSPSPRD